MKLQLIAVQMTDKQLNKFKLADISNVAREANGISTKTQLKTEWFTPENVVDMIMVKHIPIVGIEIDDRLVGSNGGFNRYAELTVQEPNKKYPLTIFERITLNNTDAYTVIDVNGRILNATTDTLVKYAEAVGISNGKVVEHNGHKYISAIKGEYPRIGIRPTYEKQDTQLKEQDDIQLYKPIKQSRSIPGYWPEGANLRDETLNLTAAEKIVVCYKAVLGWNFFIYSILSSLTLIPVKSSVCDTLGVDLDLDLVYCPKFVLKLKLEELLFVLIHECYHTLFSHPARDAQIMLECMKQQNKLGISHRKMHDMYNVAADLFVNKFEAEQFGDTIKRLLEYPRQVNAGTPFVTRGANAAYIKGVRSIKMPTSGAADDAIDTSKDTVETIFKALIKKYLQDREEKRRQEEEERKRQEEERKRQEEEQRKQEEEQRKQEEEQQQEEQQDQEEEQQQEQQDQEEEQQDGAGQGDDQDSDKDTDQQNEQNDGQDNEQDNGQGNDSEDNGQDADKDTDSSENDNGQAGSDDSDTDDSDGTESNDQFGDKDSENYNENGTSNNDGTSDEEGTDNESFLDAKGLGSSDDSEFNDDDEESDFENEYDDADEDDNVGEGGTGAGGTSGARKNKKSGRSGIGNSSEADDDSEYDGDDEEDYDGDTDDYDYDNEESYSDGDDYGDPEEIERALNHRTDSRLDRIADKLEELMAEAEEHSDLIECNKTDENGNEIEPTPQDMAQLQEKLKNWRDKLKDTVKRAESQARQRGYGLSQAERRLVDSIIKATPTDWRFILKNLFNKKTDKIQSYKRPSRRPEIDKRIVLPGYAQQKPDGLEKFLFLVDTSGSVSDDLLRMCLGAVKSLTIQCKVDVDLVYWSDNIDAVIHIKGTRDLFDAYKNVASTGGTNVARVFEAIASPKGPWRNTKIKGLIFFTDGYVGIIPTKYANIAKDVIWMIHGDIRSFDPPFGRVIHIDNEGRTTSIG